MLLQLTKHEQAGSDNCLQRYDAYLACFDFVPLEERATQPPRVPRGRLSKTGVFDKSPLHQLQSKKNEARTKKDSWWVGRRGVEGLNEWADRSFWNLVPKSSSPLICRIHIQREYIVRLVRNPIISEELFSFSRGVRTEVSAVRVQLFCRAFVW